MKYLFGLLLMLVLIMGCNQQPVAKKYHTSYYKTGALKDSIPTEKDTTLRIGYGFYPSGKLQEVTQYRYGHINGTNTGYYEDGNIQDIMFLKNDEPDSFFISFYENGVIKNKREIANGQLYGQSIAYDEKGIIKTYQFFWPPDSVLYERHYENGIYKDAYGNFVALRGPDKKTYKTNEGVDFMVVFPSPPDVRRYVCISLEQEGISPHWDTVYKQNFIYFIKTHGKGSYNFNAKLHWEELATGKVIDKVEPTKKILVQ